MSPRPVPPELRGKLAKILARLGSEHDGERAAAGLLASRLLREAGLSWEDLLAPQAATFRVVDIRPAAAPPSARRVVRFDFAVMTARQRRGVLRILSTVPGTSAEDRAWLDQLSKRIYREPHVSPSRSEMERVVELWRKLAPPWAEAA